jgi:chromosome segregation ATPase
LATLEKTKAFKCTEATLERINELIKSSNKTDYEYFDELTRGLTVDAVKTETLDYHPELSKSFGSDAKRLKESVDLIENIFLAQMQAMNVHISNVQKQIDKKKAEMDEKVQDHMKLREAAQEKAESASIKINKFQIENESLEKQMQSMQKTEHSLRKLVDAHESEIGKIRVELEQSRKEATEQFEKITLAEKLHEENEELKTTVEKLGIKQEEAIRAMKKEHELEIREVALEKQETMRKEFEESSRELRKQVWEEAKGFFEKNDSKATVPKAGRKNKTKVGVITEN